MFTKSRFIRTLVFDQTYRPNEILNLEHLNTKEPSNTNVLINWLFVNILYLLNIQSIGLKLEVGSLTRSRK